MKIEKGQMIAGQPILKVRDFFKRYERFSVETAAYFFTLSKKAAKMICLEFTELGYCKRVLPEEMAPAYRKEIRYELLPLGCSLALARAVPPITRQKADRIVQEFMDRVEEINGNEKYIYKVSKVLLFGSYIRPEATELNDVDIAVEITPKYDSPDERRKKSDEYMRSAIENGRHFRDWMDQMFAPQNDVKAFLKNKSRYISLHPSDDEVLEITETKQIYPQL
ncbi:nucleotidyltransferase domain-containing protein [Spirosoma radiotolerans]|uniref:Polymerase nucleotidyl transferase domain-containing protein n=1 Tax=Spirosoma radiotolerans TaxID=1379870 RepID=A0A0E3V8E7_9BACT|nr:nucleotidyltransferase domain-containing protein [Spirosoma radiotolerans]AKD56692.1 hypothetical protein SD10_19080 [Spirosoma radiotolerans]